MKKNKYLILFIIFFSLTASFVSAIEVDFGLGSSPDLSQYLSFIFTWALSIAGSVSLISFAVGAVGLISPSVEMHSAAKDRMKGALIGLILTIGSVAIINTINPKLANLNLNLPEIPGQPAKDAPGVYFYSDSGCTQDSSGSTTSAQANISFAGENKKLGCVRIVNNPAQNIFYGVILRKTTDFSIGAECTDPMVAGQGTPEQKFPVPAAVANDAGFVAANIFQINQTPITSGTGITFFGKTFTKAKVTGMFVVDADQIPATGLKKDLTVKPNPMCFNFAGDNQEQWTFKHKCTDSSCGYKDLFCTSNANCEGNTVCDAEFRCWGKTCKTDGDCPNLSGQVCNYELGICMGKTCNIQTNGTSSDCKTQFAETCDEKGTCIGAGQKNLPLGERQIFCSSQGCESFRDCPQSIRMSGSYVVALYSNRVKTASQIVPFCQIYQTKTATDITNLNTQGADFGAGWIKIDYIYMYPIKQ
jgi:hypothetical protein